MAGVISRPEWHAGCDSPSGRQVVSADGSDGETYCVATAHAGNGRDHSANATLIAAAPDLLQTLQKLIAHIGDGQYVSRDATLAARAAVAKATTP